VKETYPDDGRFLDLSRGANNHAPLMIALLCKANDQTVQQLLDDIANPALKKTTERDLLEILDEWLAKDTAEDVVRLFLVKRADRNAAELAERKTKRAAIKAAQAQQDAAVVVKKEDAKRPLSSKDKKSAGGASSKKQKTQVVASPHAAGGDSDCEDVTPTSNTASGSKKSASEGKNNAPDDKKRKRK